MKSIVAAAVVALFTFTPDASMAGNGKACLENKECYPWKLCTDGSCELPVANWRKGLEVELQVGTAICVEQSGICRTDVSPLNPGFGAGLYGGFRFTPYLSAGLNFGYLPYTRAENDPEMDQYARLMITALEFRGIIPLAYKCSGFGDLYAKLGVGYISNLTKITGIEDSSLSREDRVNSPVNFKLGAGITLYPNQPGKHFDLGIGIGIDYQFFNFTKDIASDPSSETMEANPKGAFLVAAHLKWVIPLGKANE